MFQRQKSWIDENENKIILLNIFLFSAVNKDNVTG